jgi:hypothetical protein
MKILSLREISEVAFLPEVLTAGQSQHPLCCSWMPSPSGVWLDFYWQTLGMDWKPQVLCTDETCSPWTV